jgi:hypothetical protein
VFIWCASKLPREKSIKLIIANKILTEIPSTSAYSTMILYINAFPGVGYPKNVLNVFSSKI